MYGYNITCTGDKNTEEIVPVTPAEIKPSSSDKNKPAINQDSSADGSASGDESEQSGESGDEDESGESAESSDEEESGESGDEEESGETAEGEVTKRSVIPTEKTGEAKQTATVHFRLRIITCSEVRDIISIFKNKMCC